MLSEAIVATAMIAKKVTLRSASIAFPCYWLVRPCLRAGCTARWYPQRNPTCDAPAAVRVRPQEPIFDDHVELRAGGDKHLSATGAGTRRRGEHSARLRCADASLKRDRKGSGDTVVGLTA